MPTLPIIFKEIEIMSPTLFENGSKFNRTGSFIDVQPKSIPRYVDDCSNSQHVRMKCKNKWNPIFPARIISRLEHKINSQLPQALKVIVASGKELTKDSNTFKLLINGYVRSIYA
eukprot:UN00878